MSAQRKYAEMARRATVVMLMATICAPSAGAQESRPADAHDAAQQQLGLRIATTGSARDTIGVLVAAVTRDGLADQAGISTGNRIVAVNGLPMRVTTDVAGRRMSSDSAASLFLAAVRSTPAGRDVMLRVSGGGAVRTIALPLRVATIVSGTVARRRTSIAASDSLAEIGAPLAIQRQRVQSLRDSATTETKPDTTLSSKPSATPDTTLSPKPSTTPDTTMLRVDGLELSRIGADLAAYLGPTADSAVVVRRAGEAYEPLRAGDVILRVDDATPDVTRLTAVLTSLVRATLVVMRRGRSFAVIIGDAVQR